jgi:aminoglycoside phosphotransferase (APT) family kinase protein
MAQQPHLEQLDPIAILRTLGLHDEISIARVAGGADTTVWRVQHQANIYALRLLRAEQALVCQREVEMMRLVAAGGIAVPAIHAIGQWQDRPAMLLEWCSGHTVADALRAQPWHVWQLGVMFGTMQARIHQVSVASNTYGQLPNWIAWAGSDEQAIRQRVAALAAPVPIVMHLDYHLLNVMTDGQRITGVLDWTNSLGGDPRADVARTRTILEVEPWSATPLPLHIALLRRLFTRAWWHGYWQVAGQVDDLAAFYAWAGAAMQRDLAPRVARAEHWMQPAHLEPVRRWTARWKQRANILDH